MNIILEGILGSVAYGLATEDSDVDRKGVYVAPINDVLGLDGSAVTEKTYTSSKPDKEFHEVGKFCRLALKCNPTILEMLFLDEYTTRTYLGEMLTMRNKFFLSTKPILGSYGAYAKAQADRLLRSHLNNEENHTVRRAEKHGRHCARLLKQGAHILRTGELQVDVSDSRDQLFKMGELAARAPEEFHGLMMAWLATFENIKSVLPDRPNRDLINSTLVDIRRLSQ